MIKAIVFDYDGTLIDSIKQIHSIGNYTLREFSLEEVSVEECKKFIGNGAKNLIEKLIKKTFEPTNEFVEKVLFRYLENYDIMQNKELYVFDGVVEMLQRLNLLNIKVAILSNKPERHLKAGVVNSLNKIKFDCIVGGGCGFPLKPDPTALLQIVEQLGISTDETLYVGDGDADVLVATNAQITSCCVLWGYRTKEELQEVGGYNFINFPSELFEYIK